MGPDNVTRWTFISPIEKVCCLPIGAIKTGNSGLLKLKEQEKIVRREGGTL